MAKKKQLQFLPTDFNRMYNNDWFTIEGCGGKLSDWVEGITNLLTEQEIGTPTEWMSFTGKEMNEQYNLTGTNAYPDNFQFLAFAINDMVISKLAMFKLDFGARWFSDIVDNNNLIEHRNSELADKQKSI